MVQEAEFGGAVVGIDGSPASLEALDWAAGFAHRHGVGLDLVMTYTTPVVGVSAAEIGLVPRADEMLSEAAEAVLRDALARLADARAAGKPVPPADRVTAAVEFGDAATALRTRSTRARLVALGERGHGGLLGRLLGSVASAVPAHASCPTVIVPLVASSRVETERLVVVGVDGSTQARLAALVAADEAHALGARLRLVWALPEQQGIGPLAFLPLDQSAEAAEIAALLESGAAWLRSHLPDLEIETAVVPGAAADVLVSASERAELLVTGTRGRGGVAGLLLGSTSQSVLGRAQSPVLIVPTGVDRRLVDRGAFGMPPVA